MQWSTFLTIVGQVTITVVVLFVLAAVVSTVVRNVRTVSHADAVDEVTDALRAAMSDGGHVPDEATVRITARNVTERLTDQGVVLARGKHRR